LGPFVLFVREPTAGRTTPGRVPGATSAEVSDVEAVRARQRAFGVPQAFEWVHEVAPLVLPAVAAALDQGDDLVFLSAASGDVARVYARIGCHRVGTACIAGLA
jgi:hypothetical protein